MRPDEAGSVTRWIGDLKAGGDGAASASGSGTSIAWSTWPATSSAAAAAPWRTRRTRP